MDNLVSEVSAVEDACSRSMVFFGIDLHDFQNPAIVLQNTRKMLRRTGTVVDLDWKDEPMTMGPPQARRFPPMKARNLLEAAGFTLKSVADAGPYNYITIARQ